MGDVSIKEVVRRVIVGGVLEVGLWILGGKEGR